MKENNILDKLMETPRIKNLGLKKGSILNILEAYNNIAFDYMLENGYVELGNGMTLEIVQLSDRVHVLRGIPYKNSRKYKLKLTMEDTVYRKIEEYYSKLQEEIS